MDQEAVVHEAASPEAAIDADLAGHKEEMAPAAESAVVGAAAVLDEAVKSAYQEGAATFADLEKQAVEALVELAAKHLPPEVMALVKGETLADVKVALEAAEKLYSDLRTGPAARARRRPCRRATAAPERPRCPAPRSR